jgi:hypothetical protein
LPLVSFTMLGGCKIALLPPIEQPGHKADIDFGAEQSAFGVRG